MTIKIEFTEQEAQLVLIGLGKLLAEQSIELILKFKDECEKQIEASKATAKIQNEQK